MLQAVEAIINPDGTVQLLENVKISRPTKVILTLLNNEAVEDGMASAKGNVVDTLAWLILPHYRSRPPGNPAEIDSTIQENRNAWGDE